MEWRSEVLIRRFRSTLSDEGMGEELSQRSEGAEKVVHIAPHNTFICSRSFEGDAQKMLTDFVEKLEKGTVLIEFDHATLISFLFRCRGSLPIAHATDRVVNITKDQIPTINGTLDAFQKMVKGKNVDFIVTLDVKGGLKKMDCSDLEATLVAKFEETGWERFSLRKKAIDESGSISERDSTSSSESSREYPLTTKKASYCEMQDGELKTYFHGKSIPLIELWKRCAPDFPAFDLYTRSKNHLMIRAFFLNEGGMFESQEVTEEHVSQQEDVTFKNELAQDAVVYYFDTEKRLRETLKGAGGECNLKINKAFPVFCVALSNSLRIAFKCIFANGGDPTNPRRDAKVVSSLLSGELKNDTSFSAHFDVQAKCVVISRKAPPSAVKLP